MKEKPLPHDIEREKAVLGAIFIRPDIRPLVQKIFNSNPKVFYKESHQRIYEAMIECLDCDLISVAGHLRERKLLKRVGGEEYLVDIIEGVNTSSGVKWHCEKLVDLYRRRKFIESCWSSISKASNLVESIEDIFFAHKNMLRNIQKDQLPDFTSNKKLVRDVFNDIEARKQVGDIFVGVPSGFKNIDRNMFGFEPSTYTIIMARPSIGKTALALNICYNVACLKKGKVLFFSLESNDRAIVRRMLSCRSAIPLSNIRNGNIENSQWPDIIEAANDLSTDYFAVLDRAKFKSIENLCSMAETIALESEISLIIIDHLQKLRSTSSRFTSRHHEVSFISDRISSLAKDLKVPLLVLSQLNREIEKRPKKSRFPMLSDLKESGDIEQDADIVIGLHRDDREDEYARLECLKGRDTGTWVEWLKFDRYIQRFYDSAGPPQEKETYFSSFGDNGL